MTALTATPQPATATRPPSMLLQVTGAPNPPATAYSSNFAAGVDGWTNTSGATLNAPANSGTHTNTLELTGPTTTADATVSRALTGLSTTTSYRYRASVDISRGEVKLVAKDTASGAVLAQTSFVTYGDPSNKTVTPTIDFRPTAGAVTVQLVFHQTSVYAGSTQAHMFAWGISVQPLGTWQGTTIRRTDVNGSSVVVREDPAGQDTAGGTMTVTDWEAALVGPVTYVVTDGNGGTASVIATHAATRVNVALNPNLSASVARTQSDGVVGRFARGDRWFAFASTGTYLYMYGGGTPGHYYAASIVAAGTPGTPYSLGSSDNVTGPFTEARTGVIPPSGEVRVSLPAAAAVTGSGVATLSVGYTSGVSSDLLLTELLLEEVAGPGGETGDYFDGSTADAGDVRHYWSGPVNDSASVETAEPAGALPWISLPATATPSAGAAGAPRAASAPLVIGYDEAAQSVGTVHQIIGRRDKVANPGPLSTRSGTLELLELDYEDARALRELLAGGDTALLRQPTIPALDLYFVPMRVRTNRAGRRWAVAIDYEEVVAP